MRTRRRFKKFRSVLAISSTFVGLAFALDMAVAGSVHHPLTYVYDIASRLLCENSHAQTCNKTESPVVSGKNGAVVTTQHNASEIGLEILKAGGNAVDAAVAVGYASAVADPCCGNIGGGGFMLIHLANGKDTFIDFREKAPLSATKNMYLDKQGNVMHGLSTDGYLAVGVPGTVMGLEQALSQYGTMTRSTLMAPAIKLAEFGFILRQGDIDILNAATQNFRKQPNVASIFLKDGKNPWKVGDRLVQKNLAQTLKLISTLGVDAFYKGAIAQEVVKASRENGGILTPEDFAKYTVSQTQPVRCNYRSYEVITAPPPGGGTTLCEMLNILEGYPLKQFGWHSKDSLHLMLSAMLYAYADRNNYLGDPDFVKNPVERLLSKGYAAKIRSQIPKERAIPPEPLYSGMTSHEGTHTTHYSIIDRYGNAVAVTYTINSYFGSGVMAGNTGFLLNNEMDDFAAKPGVPNNFGLVQGNLNAIEPGKRPLSSMTPTIVTKNGKVFIVTGSPGGSTITTTVLQVLTNVIDYDMDIAQAVNAPRIHYQGLPNVVRTEPLALKSNVVQQLFDMGYKVTPVPIWGAAESILVDPKTELRNGGHDSRKGAGSAEAY
ncbi:MAG: gamma-glutamyltransferase [Stigonema ocellatum SAG 48.90 = DSM 106950]|nr:gamma-glutamyltransferase [Stigonema ocellatum SAG 48.90 = DSM 106950]